MDALGKVAVRCRTIRTKKTGVFQRPANPDIARVTCCGARFDHLDVRHIAGYSFGQSELQLRASLRFSSPRQGDSYKIRAKQNDGDHIMMPQKQDACAGLGFHPFRLSLCLLFVCVLLPWLTGCTGEGFPDPEPPSGEPPVIHEFQRQTPEGGWEPTVEGAVGSTIGIVGENFGQDASVLEVVFKEVSAPIQGIEPIEGSDMLRIITVVPQGATTGEVFVAREGIRSKGVIFYLVQFVKNSFVMDILFENENEGWAGDHCASTWLATQGGGLVHVEGDLGALETGAFQRYTTIEGLLSLNPFALLQDPEGRILVGTQEAGLNIKGRRGFVNFTKDDGLPANGIASLYLTERSGDLLMGTGRGLVVWRNYGDNASSYLDRIDSRPGDPLEPENPPWEFFLRRRGITAFLEEPESGRLLVAAHNGIYVIGYDVFGERWNYITPRKLYPVDESEDREGCWPYFTSLAKDEEGRLLAGSFADGLYVFKSSTDFEDPVVLFDELEGRGVSKILKTRLGNCYLVTGHDGLWQVEHDEEDHPFVTPYQLGKTYHSIQACPLDGRVYLGANEGVTAFEEDEQGPVRWYQWIFPKVLDGDNIQCLAPDGVGGVFIGTRDRGLTRFNGDFSNPSFVRVPPVIPEADPRHYENFISALRPVPGEPGRLFVGTSRGLGKLDYRGSDPVYEPLLEWDHGVHMISQILPLTPDRILLGTLADGLLDYSLQDGGYEFLSTGTRFRIHAEDFLFSDFSFLVPVSIGGGDWVTWTVSNFRLNPDHQDPAGGTVNLFVGEGETPKVYAHMDGLLSLEFCNVRSDNVETAIFFEGTLQGGEQAGNALTLELKDLIGGVQTEWWVQDPTNVLYVWSLLDLIISGVSEPVPLLRQPVSLGFTMDEERSGVYFLWYRMDHFEGGFSTTFDRIPIEQAGPSPSYFITSLMEDRSGNVLVGTEEDGLFVLDPEDPDLAFRHFTKRSFLDQWPEQVSSFAEAPDGGVFLGTFQRGLWKLEGYTGETPTLTRMGTGDGELPTQNITALEYLVDPEAPDTGLLLVGIYDTQNRFNTGLAVCRIAGKANPCTYKSLNASNGLIPARIQDILLVGEDLYLGTAQGLCVIQSFPALIRTLFSDDGS